MKGEQILIPCWLFFYQTTDIFPFRLTNGLRFGLKIDE